MKKLSFLLAVVLLLGISELAQAQLAKSSWSLGFGFSYPRFVSINTRALNSNYGGFLSFQRNFSEHVAIRLKTGYSHLESEFTDVFNILQNTTTDVITGNLNLMYYFVPCEPVSPYLFAGVGGNYRMLSNYLTAVLGENVFVMGIGMGLGFESYIDEDWKFVSEFGYHIVNNSELEGAIGPGEINGRDSYIDFSVGFLYFLGKGEPSKYCQLYSGIAPEVKDMTDYNRIEEIVKSNIPKEITKEVVVEKPVPAASIPEKWVLIGVNFNFNSSKLTPESYPILYDAAKTLLKNREVSIEIQGYTDNIGTEAYNKALSQKRAEIVKNYLVSKGIDSGRLTAIGMGESDPVADNRTADGRALNRRIEFKVQ